MSIQVVRAGMQMTIQDLGRHGYQQYGLNVNGVMDESAARVANILVGNDESSAVLELTLTGTSIKLTQEYMIAICGGDMTPTLDGVALPMWQPIIAPKGGIINFGQYHSGCRVYVAAAGGFKLEKVLGSYSTNIRGNIGGFAGRALRNGDVLDINEVEEGSKSYGLWSSLRQGHKQLFNAQHFAIAQEKTATIRCIVGSEYEWLDDLSRTRFMESTWIIDSQSDRMGYRLQGPDLAMKEQKELISEGVVHGTIQLPAQGQPIVLLADRQTTGGYPKIAVVASVDIPMFGQLKPGDAIKFVPTTLEEAERLWLNSEQDIRRLKAAIQLKSKL